MFKVILFVILLISAGCNNNVKNNNLNNSDSKTSRGIHGGKLFHKDDFVLELKIFETGVPPQYRVYGYYKEKPISPEEFKAKVVTMRLGDIRDEYILTPVEDFLTSSKIVEEPHSFDVEVSATYAGSQYKWNFPSYEGRTSIPDKVAKISGIVTEKADTKTINSYIPVSGKIFPDEHKIAHIIPRFSGIVQRGTKHVGDIVSKGELLAVIESNQSLQPFNVYSQIPGVVINGHLIAGEYVPENQWIYVIADLSKVWADFFIPVAISNSIKLSQKVYINSLEDEELLEGKISYLAPYIDEKTQSRLVRVVIPNDGRLFPGMYVSGKILNNEYNPKVVINRKAIQKFRDWNVAFIKIKDTYEIRILELGRSEAEFIEVISGLNKGDEYVVENSFLIKADILKSGASHDH
jgi:membrane fusion protein, heavy metal efflux system